MRLAAGTAPEDIGGTMLRLCAYIAGPAVLGVMAVTFLRLPDVAAAVGPTPRPLWIEVEHPHPAFELLIPELGGPASRYAIFRREADNVRKDVLSWGEAAGSGLCARTVDLERDRYCSAGAEVIDRALLACALDRLTILSAAGDAKARRAQAQLLRRAQFNPSGNARGPKRRCRTTIREAAWTLACNGRVVDPQASPGCSGWRISPLPFGSRRRAAPLHCAENANHRRKAVPAGTSRLHCP